MLMQFVVTCIISGLIALWSISRHEAKRKKNYPPGPISLPIVGSLLHVLWVAGLSGLLTDKATRITKKFGSFAWYEVGSLVGVLTDDHSVIKEVLNSPDLIGRFPDHPRFKEHTLDQNLGLMFGSGEPNREMRNFSIRTLKTFGFGELKTAEGFLQEELKEMSRVLDEQLGQSPVVHFQHYFKIPTFNILWRVMGGYRAAYDDPKIIKLIHAVEDVASINIGMDPEWSFPILRFVPGLSPSRAKRESFVTCYDFFRDIMSERRKKSTFLESQVDFIDYFLKKVEEEKSNKSTLYTDDQFLVTCVDLLFAALDTTANSIGFGILYMVINPEVQKRVQSEIDTVVGRDRVPSVTDRAKLRYSEATMLETLRVANIVPHNGRTALCDTTLGGYFIPKDSLIGMNTTRAHMDPRVWGDPETFRPDRFLDENLNIINSEKLLAFGAGKRACIGQTMAKVIWLSFFTGLLQRYTFEKSLDYPSPSTVPSQGVTNTPQPFHCVVKLRE